MSADPALPTYATTIRKLEHELAGLRLRLEVIEKAFGVEPPREMRITARPDASLLRARSFGLKGGVKGQG